MLIRVRRMSVKGLFDLYDHDVTLFLDERVTILHGPNGVGKTVLLRLVHALFSQDYLVLLSIPFSSFRVELDDRSTIVATRLNDAASAAKGGAIAFHLFNESGEHSYLVGEESLKYDAWAQAYEQQSPYIYPLGDSRWMYQPTEQVFTSAELYQRFGSETSSRIPPPISVALPEPFDTLYKRVNTFFIEAQRLIRTNTHRGRRGGRDDSSMMATVMVDAKELAQQLSSTLLNYTRHSQELDQSFPQRLFQGNFKTLTGAEVKEAIQELEGERTRLNNLGVLDIQLPALPLNFITLEEIDEATRKAMSLYVNDSQSKLRVLTVFANRVEPLINSINSRFKNKTVKLDREKGLVAQSASLDEIRPDQLSSGEQHEIVLLYALMFRVAANTLVLIDEPELSLHIDWQRQFLPELIAIANRTGFDALVATHSTSIVGDRADLMVGLSAELAGTHAH